MIKLELTEEENELIIEAISEYRDACVEKELVESILSGDVESELSEETQRIIRLSEKIGCEMKGKLSTKRIDAAIEFLRGINDD